MKQETRRGGRVDAVRGRSGAERLFAPALVLALLGGVVLGIRGWQLPSAVRMGLLVFDAGVLAIAAYTAWLRRWRDYDPTWLAELARRQRPDEPWLAEALTRCTRASWESDVYLRFVSPRRPNRPGSAWQFAANATLEDEAEGDLVLDVLTDHRIGGVEFLSRLLSGVRGRGSRAEGRPH